MRRGLDALVALTCSLLVLAVAGCGEVRVMHQSQDGDWLPPRAATGLVADPHSPIPDVPMPVGFVAVASKCRAGATTVSRNVLHVYEGRATLREAVDFYRQQPPQKGWQVLGEQSAGNDVMMWYEKGSERLAIQLTRSGGTVTATLGIADGWTMIPGAVPMSGPVGAAPTSSASAWLKP